MAFMGGYALIQVPFLLMDKDFEKYSELFDEDEEEEEENEPISDWKDTPEARVLQAELPGFNKEDIKVEVKNYKVLTITGGATHQHPNQKPIKIFFARQIPLPEDIKAKEITCNIDDGILIVKAPKSATPKPTRRLLAITN